ncbi:MAG: hypothetical protein GX262_02210 [Clostridia bacterium]|jgi:uncharacterized protein YrrD|nr:hypothetical protein [Clostridia bacterium]
MYRSKKLLTLPVISLNDGEELGKVQGVIVDPEARSLAALILDYRKGIFKEPRIIPFEHITSFGDYAVTIKDSGACERAGQSPHLGPLFRRPTQILGAKVLTEDGNFLGTVEEFCFDRKTGKINGLELSNSFLNTLVRGKTLIEGDVITTIGKSAIIVKAGTQSVVKEESHLSEKAKTVKETGQKVWHQTKETTKKFGESLYKSVEKFTADEEDYSPADSSAPPKDKPVDNPPGDNSTDPTRNDKAC